MGTNPHITKDNIDKFLVEGLDPVHPGRILQRGMARQKDNIEALSHRSGIAVGTLQAILDGELPFVEETAEAIGKATSTNRRSWMNAQTLFDLGSERQKVAAESKGPRLGL